MSLYMWRGDAQGIANVWWAVPANVQAGDIFKLTINRKTISVVAGTNPVDPLGEAVTADIANVVALFIEAISIAGIPEWNEVVATAGTASGTYGAATHLILTGPGDGKPLVITSSTVDAGNLGIQVDEIVKGDPGANQINRVSFPSQVTGGTWTLTFAGQTASALAWNISTADLTTALVALSNVNSGDVVVTGVVSSYYDIEFKQAYANIPVGIMTADGASLTRAAGVYNVSIQVLNVGAAGQNEKQQVSINPVTSGGTFKLGYNGTETGTIAYGASAGTVQSALEAIAAIGAGQVLVTGASPVWVVEFTGTLARADISPLVGNGAALTGSSPVTTAIKTEGHSLTNEVQTVTWSKTGYFWLNFTNHLGVSGNTPTLYGTSPLSDIINSFTNLLSVQAGNVLITEVPALFPTQTAVRVEFIGALAGYNQGTIGGLNMESAPVTQGGDPAVDEVQFLQLGGATGGTYTLSFRTFTTSGIAYNAIASTIQAALVAACGAGTFTVALASGSLFEITAAGSLVGTDIPLIVPDSTSLTGGPVYVSQSQAFILDIPGVQSITVLGSPVAGTFTLSYNGYSTGNTARLATAATIKAALDALTSIDTVGVVGNAGGPWTVTFNGTHLGTHPFLMSSDPALLTGGAISVSTIIVSIPVSNEVQLISLTGNPDGGTFTLTYAAQTTAAPISYNASAADVGNALEGLSTIDPGEIDVQGFPGGPWTVYFLNGLGAQDVSTISGDGANLTATGTQTLVVTEKIVGTGPHHWDQIANWDTNSLPVDGSTVLFADGESDCLYGLAQGTITPVELRIDSSYIGTIGLPLYSDSGYWEYRARYLRICDVGDASPSIITIGSGDGRGSGRINLDTGTAQITMTVYNTGAALDENTPALVWKGTHASNVIRGYKGNVGVAAFPGETAVISALTMDYVSNKAADFTLDTGALTTLGTIVKYGGILTIAGGSGSPITSLLQEGGETTIKGTDGLSSLILRDGQVFYNTTGTLGGDAVISDQGELNFNGDIRTKTVTNPMKLYGERSDIVDDNKVVTTLRYVDVEGKRTGRLGRNCTFTRS